MQTVFLFGPLAQLGERQVRNLEVRGSIPLWSTKEASHRQRRWDASLVDHVRIGERTPSAAAEQNGRIAMIAPRRCVNPPIPGGMNVRQNRVRRSSTGPAHFGSDPPMVHQRSIPSPKEMGCFFGGPCAFWRENPLRRSRAKRADCHDCIAPVRLLQYLFLNYKKGNRMLLPSIPR